MSRLLLLALLCAVSMPASAFYKCKTGTQITYSDTACTNGATVRLDDPVSTQAAEDAQQHLATDKAELHRLTSERRKNEAVAERAQEKSDRAAAARRKRCAVLEQRRHWADEDARAANRKALENAKRTARRAAEKYTLFCEK